MEYVQALYQSMSGQVPRLVVALGVLVVGWIAALLVSALVRVALGRTTIDNRIAGWMAGDKDKGVPIERILGRIVFWLLMVLVLVAFFQVLGLTLVTEPLTGFLNQIFEFLPRLLSAGALFALAWILATAVRFAVARGLRLARLDERLGEEAAEPPEEGEGDAVAAAGVPLSRTLSETAYWLIYLLFLPAILEALSLQGLLEPVTGLLGEILAFLPNLVAAGLILVVGWFLARIVRRIVTNLLAAAGADGLGERLGLDKALGPQRLSGVVGVVVYVLILLPVLVASLNALELEAVTRPASEMLSRILAALPLLFGAALVLAVAFVVGRIVAGLVTNLLAALGLDAALGSIGFGREAVEGKKSASEIVGYLALVAVMLFAAIEALELMGFALLAGLVTNFTVFAGKVLLGLFVFGLGLYLAKLAADTIRATATSQSPILATAARVAIIGLAGAMALREMNVADDIINLTFGLVVGAAAVAAALAFGLGGRDAASRLIEDWSRRTSGKG